MSVLPVAVAVVTWCCLLLRYYLKVPRHRVRTVLLIAALTPVAGFGAAVAKGFALELTAWLLAAAAAIPWLATGFKPELMIDSEPGADDEEQDRTERYQWRAVLIVVVLALVGTIVFWDRLAE